MDTTDPRQCGDPGLYGCDRDLFARVWDRVAPENSPVEVTPPQAPPPEPCREDAPPPEPCHEDSPPCCPITATGGEDAQPQPEALFCFAGGGGEAKELQALIVECQSGAALYRRTAGRSHRGRPQLLSLAQTKTHHAKRLGAACFLMTGVRYSPEAALAPPPAGDFFALLRERFLAEQRLAHRLQALGDACQDPCLQELYLSLAQETRDLVRAVRLLVEQET